MSKPIDYDELFPGRFLKAGLFRGKPVTLRITDVHVEALPQDNGQEKTRGILSFAGTDKQLVLNSTNGQCIRCMFGRSVQEWIGKRITLVSERVQLGAKQVDGIRVKGSPELVEAITVMVELPRKKPRPRKLIPTGKQDRASQPELADDAGGELPPEAQEQDEE